MEILVVLCSIGGFLLRLPIFMDWRDLKARGYVFKFNPALYAETYTKNGIRIRNLPKQERVKFYIYHIDYIINNA